MKINVNSTFSYIKFNLNYGSVLQCYALQKYLTERGHIVTLLRDYRANPIYILQRLKNIRHLKLFLQKVKAQIDMQHFMQNYIALSDKWYLSDAKLKRTPPEADCYIVGSDQIWHNANEFRYLTYAPDDKIKLSYAASFGRSEISHEMKREIQPRLRRFNGISVREESGVKILKELGFDAECVLDPTLLLDWQSYPYREAKQEKSYYYCYFLNLTNRSDIPFENIKKIAQNNGREVLVTAPLNYPLFKREHLIFPAVEEWLGLYKNAECIFTNTYHGLLFCIIFKKQFIFFKQKGGSAAENSRFSTVLERLDLTDRAIDVFCENEIQKKMKQAIDYDSVYKKLNIQRNKTDDFFQKFGI